MAKKEKDLRGAAEHSIRETQKDIEKRIDEIRADLKDRGPEAVARIENALTDLREQLQNRFEYIHESFEDKLEMGRKEVREHPLLAIGVALTLGVMIGMLLERKGKD